MRILSTKDHELSESLKLIPVQANLAQDAALRPSCNLPMLGHDGGAKTLLRLLGELDVTDPLANLDEADLLQLSLDFGEGQRSRR
jgi:hypothetical protein